MTRALLRVVAAAFVLVGLVLIPSVPAFASPDTCTGIGTATTDGAMFLPGFGPDVHGGIHLSLSLGGCFLDPVPHSGTINGDFGYSPAPLDSDNCLHSTGNLNAWGHAFSWVSVGSMFVLFGDGSGQISFVCPNGATTFAVALTLVMT